MTIPHFIAEAHEPGVDLSWVLTLSGLGSNGVTRAVTSCNVLRVRPDTERLEVFAFLMNVVGEGAGLPDGHRNVLFFSLDPAFVGA